MTTATVLFRLCAPPNSDEYPLRSLVELDDVGDSGTTFMKPTDINNGGEVLY